MAIETFYLRNHCYYVEKAELFRLFNEALDYCFAPSSRVVRLELHLKVKKLFGRTIVQFNEEAKNRNRGYHLNRSL